MFPPPWVPRNLQPLRAFRIPLRTLALLVLLVPQEVLELLQALSLPLLVLLIPWEALLLLRALVGPLILQQSLLLPNLGALVPLPKL